jgi:hypothetical protein
MAYRIAWRSKITGIESHGEAVFENKDAAMKAAKDANDICLVHWVEEVA